MNSFLILDDEDMNYIWGTIQQLQIIFHPEIAPFGQIDIKKFFEIKTKKSVILFVDRNVLSGLLNFCEKGSMRDKGESQILGLIMSWTEMNDISISAGLAVQERATQTKNQEEGLKELQKFLEIFEAYPGQTWLKIAEGQETEIIPISFSGTTAKDITVDYSIGCDHYYMMVASMLHIVNLYRKQDIKAVDKIIDFLSWTYDNLLLCQYALAYAVLLFTGQANIKAPKGANTNDIDRIVSGCENQAWDISYLSNWSTLYWNNEEYSEEFMFATNDILLKRIFINTHGSNGVNGLLYEAFSKKDYNKICNYIEERQANRTKPDFGKESQAYFDNLIREEKDELIKILGNS
ncbi:MAG: hypothetical protein PHY47_17985 [Lachnospiraceae bacterium]|nr:hypothetical protein [Lachnospiraceae bacterium]